MGPQEHVSMSAEIMEPLGFDSVADLSSEQPLPSIPSGAIAALVQAEHGAVRWRDDGNAPVAGFGGGMLIAENQVVLFTGNLPALQFIEDTVIGGKISVSYSKY